MIGGQYLTRLDLLVLASRWRRLLRFAGGHCMVGWIWVDSQGQSGVERLSELGAQSLDCQSVWGRRGRF